jgi:integrase
MRQPKPFYRKQTKSWYVQLGKKQHNLGSDKTAAMTAYYTLMAGKQELADSSQVVAVLRKFLEWNKKHRAAGSHKFYSRPILSFAQHVGDALTVANLKNSHVTDWIDAAYAGQSSTYRRNAIRAVQRAFNWAVDEGDLSANPIKTYKKPAARSRDAILEPADWEKVAEYLRKWSGEFLDYATILRATGCRPQEARQIEARHLDKAKRCLVFERDESKGNSDAKQVARRVVPLSDEAFTLCAKLALCYPSGPIFRNQDGEPWTRRAVGKHFERIARKTGVKISAYVLRHTFATQALMNGLDPITVATLMGHKDLKQLMETYQHLNKQTDYLRQAMAKAVTPLPPVSLSA